MTTKTALPGILRGVRGTCEVRFHYTARDGSDVYVSGHFDSLAGTSRENVTGIRVRLGGASTVPGRTGGDVARFDLDRIKADPLTGLIIPVSKKEMASGTGGARYMLATDTQVRYALSLCGRDCPGGGNFYQPDEAEFRAMSRHEVSQWIDMAKDELGAWL